jgi:hypothetical protein
VRSCKYHIYPALPHNRVVIKTCGAPWHRSSVSRALLSTLAKTQMSTRSRWNIKLSRGRWCNSNRCFKTEKHSSSFSVFQVWIFSSWRRALGACSAKHLEIWQHSSTVEHRRGHGDCGSTPLLPQVKRVMVQTHLPIGARQEMEK